jgi:tRNA (guanine37-N1)-methyltransferase
MKIDIISIFPDFFKPFLETSMIRKAIMYQHVEINVHDLRFYSSNKHKKVDDTPYGGGAGMVMTFQPFYDAIQALKKINSLVVLLTPQGELFNQTKANKLSKKDHLILLCGHYEGIDHRIMEYVDLELSIGDYVLTGGEIPAMIVADAITRLLPGVLHHESRDTDSLQIGILKYPQYTKPEVYNNHPVPEVLLSGNHQDIEKWRLEQSLLQTYLKRPDLIKKAKLSENELKVLEKIKKTNKKRSVKTKI